MWDPGINKFSWCLLIVLPYLIEIFVYSVEVGNTIGHLSYRKYDSRLNYYYITMIGILRMSRLANEISFFGSQILLLYRTTCHTVLYSTMILYYSTGQYNTVS